MLFSEVESQVDLEIFVKDTGIGIAEDNKKAIFQEFEQEYYSISE